jgi:hypothetical protein
MTSAALAALLDEGACFDAEYRGGLSNHLPMALQALQALGADAARLQAFAQRYSRRLQPARPAEAWPAGEPWAARLGDPAAWPAYRDLFAQWLAYEDAGDVLRQVLPLLMQGCGAAAFHGLIRTASAVQATHRQRGAGHAPRSPGRRAGLLGLPLAGPGPQRGRWRRGRCGGIAAPAAPQRR